MTARRLDLVTCVLAAFVLAACQPAQEPPRYLGSDSTCQREPTRDVTPPLHTFTVSDGSVQVDRDPVVQHPAVGQFGWTSPSHDWRVTYLDGSPISDSTVTGDRGRVVWERVPADVRCRAYPYVVEMWQDADTVSDTINGDEIEPYRWQPKD